MKWDLNILAVLLFLMGTVWILQGIGLYPVGFMVHQMKYAYYGIVVDIISVGLFVLANWPRKNLPPRS